MIGLVAIYMACGSSPIEDEEQEQNKKQPDLKDMVHIPAGEFLMGSPEGEGAFDEHPQHIVYLDEYYIDKYYAHSPAKNPMGPETGQFRILRGGSWANSDISNLRCASRTYKLPDYSSNFVGFRCAWNP